MKNLIALLVTFISLNSNATHFTAGEMYYTYLGNDDYEVSVLFYRDCSGAPFDNPLHITVFDSADNVVQTVSMNYSIGTEQLVNFSSLSNASCLALLSDTCLEYFTYSATVNLPPINGGYLLSYQRCCLTSSVVNVDSPSDWGLTFTCKIPGLETGQYANSSPRFNGHSLFWGCTNELINFDHSATDPDGDSLVYSIVVPETFNINIGANPDPEMPPPYALLQYANGFTAQDPLGAGGTLTIDASTGMMEIEPLLIGGYMIGVKVDEYKSDTLINSTFRTFAMKASLGNVGIEENTVGSSFSVAPNPVVDEVTVVAQEAHSLVILTADGKVILEREAFNMETYSIDMEYLPSGIYFFRFSSNSGTVTKSIYK